MPRSFPQQLAAALDPAVAGRRLTSADYAALDPRIQRVMRMAEGAANVGTLSNEARTQIYQALQSAGYPLGEVVGPAPSRGAGTPGECGRSGY